ncbi:hypothetical protein V8E54_014397 [Elaphomyces granulatus]
MRLQSNMLNMRRMTTQKGRRPGDLQPAGGDDFAAPGEPISVYDVYPFIYDGSMLTEDGSMPNSGYDINHFTDQTTVGVDVSFLASLFPCKASTILGPSRPTLRPLPGSAKGDAL